MDLAVLEPHPAPAPSHPEPAHPAPPWLAPVPSGCAACAALAAVRGEGHALFVAELGAGLVLLHADQTHRGHVVFAAKHHVADLLDLAPNARDAYLADLALVMQAVRAAVAPRRLDTASAFDSGVAGHLAWHVVPRHAEDPLPNAPFWAADRPGEAKPPDDALRAELRKRLLRGFLAASPVRRHMGPLRGVAR